MINLYYYDENGKKSESVTIDELTELAQMGAILPDTRMETCDGHEGTAGEISGLFVVPLKSRNETRYNDGHP